MSKKEISCLHCVKRATCVKACLLVEKILSAEQKHFQGREILVSPHIITAIYAGAQAPSLREMTGDKLNEADLKMIPGMTMRQKSVLRMTFVEEMSQRAIARRLGISQTTVGEHLMAARKKVRSFLNAGRKGARASLN